MTTIGVVVAAFKRPDSLANCLSGLRAQTVAPAEVVVIVNAADEASDRLVAEWEAGWPELHRAQPDRDGTVAAYNRGITATRTDLIAFVDDDAVPEPDWLARIVSAFERDARVAAVGGRDIVVDSGVVLEPEPERLGVWAARPSERSSGSAG